MKRIFTSFIWICFFTTDHYAQVPNLVVDISEEDSEIRNLRSANGKLYFTADEGNGEAPYYTDGTEAGTVDFSGEDVFYTSEFVAFNGLTYFIGEGNETGDELWRMDPTTGETTLFYDVFPGDWSGMYGILGVMNDKLYFTAQNGILGYEMWSTDGTVEGTAIVKDIRPGENSAYQNTSFIIYNDRLYFGADDGVNGIELWSSDGTESGTFLVKNMSEGGNSGIQNMTVWNGMLYLHVDVADAGLVLWKSDGTESGTVALKTLVPEEAASFFRGRDFMPFNGRLYFSAGTSSDNIRDMWSTDGTEEGTVIEMTNAQPGIVYNDELYFSATNTNNFIAMNKMDMQGNITVLASIGASSSSNPAPFFFKVYQSMVFFCQRYNDAAASYAWSYLWRSDGSAAGTNKVLNSFGSDMLIQTVTGLVLHNDDLYFVGTYSAIGDELYRMTVVTSAEELKRANDICVYPNPAHDYLRITNQENKVSGISIRDMHGSLVVTFSTFQSAIDISQLPTGLYHCEIEMMTSERVSTRIVKQ